MSRRLVDLREQVPLLDIASYGRGGPTHTARLTQTQIQMIDRTVRRVPEVMVKVSGGGRSAGAVRAHLKYIDRHGRLAIETDDGEQLKGRGVEKFLLHDWALRLDANRSDGPYSGAPGRKPRKLVHNIVLSMPSGTPPEKLLRAAKHFARENFALKNRYAMVLHTDQGHPHVHLVVKAVGEDGTRLNIRKATLQAWRQDFAVALRQQGVEANATDRAMRGRPNFRKHNGIYWAGRRGASTHLLGRARTAASDVVSGSISIEPAKARLVQSRQALERGWRAIRVILNRDGHADTATRLDHFLNDLPAPQTEREWMAAQLRTRQQQRARERGPPR